MFVSGTQSQHWDGDRRDRGSLGEGFRQCRYDSQQSLCLVVLGIQGHTLAHGQAGRQQKINVITKYSFIYHQFVSEARQIFFYVPCMHAITHIEQRGGGEIYCTIGHFCQEKISPPAFIGENFICEFLSLGTCARVMVIVLCVCVSVCVPVTKLAATYLVYMFKVR